MFCKGSGEPGRFDTLTVQRGGLETYMRIQLGSETFWKGDGWYVRSAGVSEKFVRWPLYVYFHASVA